MINEAKKKKEKAEKNKVVPQPAEYRYAEAFDFSAPLGAYNLYRQQGAVNWGPMTSGGTKVDENMTTPAMVKLTLESAVAVIPESSAWNPFLQEARISVRLTENNSWRLALKKLQKKNV